MPREAHGYGAKEVEQTGEPAPAAMYLEGKNDGQGHRDRSARQGEDDAVDDAVCGRRDGCGRPEEKQSLIIQGGEIGRYDPAHPYVVEAHHEDAEDGQDDGNEDVEDVVARRLPTSTGPGR